MKNDKSLGKNPVDNLPRANIANEANALLPKITDNKDWKKRKEGCEDLMKIMSQNNNRIKTDGLYDLINAIKARLSDSNKSVVRMYLGFVGTFAKACGTPIKTHAKLLIPPLINNLSDK